MWNLIFANWKKGKGCCVARLKEHKRKILDWKLDASEKRPQKNICAIFGCSQGSNLRPLAQCKREESPLTAPVWWSRSLFQSLQPSLQVPIGAGTLIIYWHACCRKYFDKKLNETSFFQDISSLNKGSPIPRFELLLLGMGPGNFFCQKIVFRFRIWWRWKQLF